jgi:hypothetical protein
VEQSSTPPKATNIGNNNRNILQNVDNKGTINLVNYLSNPTKNSAREHNHGRAPKGQNSGAFELDSGQDNIGHVSANMNICKSGSQVGL